MKGYITSNWHGPYKVYAFDIQGETEKTYIPKPECVGGPIFARLPKHEVYLSPEKAMEVVRADYAARIRSLEAKLAHEREQFEAAEKDYREMMTPSATRAVPVIAEGTGKGNHE